MCELEAAFQKHLGQVSKAQLVAEPPPHHQEDHVGGKPEEVEGSASPIVEQYGQAFDIRTSSQWMPEPTRRSSSALRSDRTGEG